VSYRLYGQVVEQFCATSHSQGIAGMLLELDDLVELLELENLELLELDDANELLEEEELQYEAQPASQFVVPLG